MKVMAGGFRTASARRPRRSADATRGRHAVGAQMGAEAGPTSHTTIPSMTDMDQLDENLRAMAEPFAARRRKDPRRASRTDQPALLPHVRSVRRRLRARPAGCRHAAHPHLRRRLRPVCAGARAIPELPAQHARSAAATAASAPCNAPTACRSRHAWPAPRNCLHDVSLALDEFRVWCAQAARRPRLRRIISTAISSPAGNSPGASRALHADNLFDYRDGAAEGYLILQLRAHAGHRLPVRARPRWPSTSPT